ncbi:hypothetical protein ACJX0J_021172 [Zea mays]
MVIIKSPKNVRLINYRLVEEIGHHEQHDQNSRRTTRHTRVIDQIMKETPLMMYYNHVGILLFFHNWDRYLRGRWIGLVYYLAYFTLVFAIQVYNRVRKPISISFWNIF